MRICLLALGIILCCCVPNNNSQVFWPEEFNERYMPFRPGDKMVCRQNPPDFSWPLIENAEMYHLQVSRTFEEKAKIQHEAKALKTNYYNFPVVFEAGTWYWRVRFKTSSGWSEWTEPGRFRIAPDAWEFPVPSVKELIDDISDKHPRVYASRESLETFRSRAEGNGKQYFERLEKSVKANLNNPLSKEPVYGLAQKSSGKTEESIIAGRNLVRTSGDAVDEMHNDALYYLITGDSITGQKAKKQLLNIASWDPEGSTSYDTHDVVHRYITYKSAMAYDWCYDILTVGDRDMVLNMIKVRTERMLYLLDKVPQDPYDSHGWTAYGFIGIISVAILHDLPEAADWFLKVIPGYINILPPWGDEDGGWAQGTRYWASSSQKNKEFVNIFREAGGINLFNKTYGRNEGLFGLYMTLHGTNTDDLFSDARYIANPSINPVLKILAVVNNDPVSKWLQQVRDSMQSGTTQRESASINDYLFDNQSVPPIPPVGYPPSRWFRDVGWVAMHSDLLDPERISCFFKSSWYGSYSHSHADQNSFIIKAFGEDITDGNGYYDYWNSIHHRDYNRQTLAKNAITYNGGQGQSVHDMDAKGEITGFVHHPFFDVVSGDATPAYKGGLDRAVRHMIYIRPSTFIVIDDLAAKTGTSCEFEWNLHSRDRLAIDKDQSGAMVERGKAILKARIHYPIGITASMQDRFISPDGTEVLPIMSYARMKGPLRAIFKMPKTEQTSIISTMEVYRQGSSPKGIVSQEHSNYLVLKTDNGSRVLVRKDSEGEVDAGNILFTGAAIAEKDGAILLLSGRAITRDGVKLLEADKDVTIIIEEDKFIISCPDDMSVRLHLPGVTRLYDEDSIEIPGTGDASYNAILTGIHWKKDGDYVVMDIEKGSYTVRVRGK